MKAQDLRNKILRSKDQKQVPVGPVPEWEIEDDVLFIKTMDGEELANFTESMNDARLEAAGTKAEDPNAEDKVFDSNIRARLLVRTLVDKDGDRVFTNEDLAALNKKNGAVLVRLFHKAQELNGLGKLNQDEMVKPSGQVLSSANGSGLPGDSTDRQ